MKKLYIDFDGVILDTIKVTYKMIENLGLGTEEEVRDFYYNLDWDHLIEQTPEINDSISCIKKIIKSNLFDVKILTHIISYNEGLGKIKYLKSKIPELEVILVPKQINKADMVNPKDSILIDDFLGNLDLWHKNGGIAIKFSDGNKKSKYITITKLDQILDMECVKEV